MHRHLVAMGSWRKRVDPGRDTASTTVAFKLGVAQAFGVSTDKKNVAVSASFFDTLFDSLEDDNNPVFAAAVFAIEAMLRDGREELNSQDIEIILAAQEKLGAGEGFLDGLMAFTRYSMAKKANESFDADIMYEVDGVTNGPALVQILLGMMDRDNEGAFGFYRAGASIRDYAQYRTAGNEDLYEATLGKVLGAIGQISALGSREASLIKAFYGITGPLGDVDTGKITSAGRGWIKQPLTSIIFGASINKTVNNMFAAVVEDFYTSLAKAANSKDPQTELKRIFDNLNTIMVAGKQRKIVPVTDPEAAMNFELDKWQMLALRNGYKDTIGAALREGLKGQFGTYLERRDKLNSAAQSMFGMYKAAYATEKKLLLTQKAAKGQLTTWSDDYRQDLTEAEDQTIIKKLSKLFPLVHTAMSLETGDRNEGMLSASAGRSQARATDSSYAQSLRFGTEVKTNVYCGGR